MKTKFRLLVLMVTALLLALGATGSFLLAAAPAGTGNELYFLQVMKSYYGYQSDLWVVNPGNEVANGGMSFHWIGGGSQYLYTDTFTLAAGQAVSISAESFISIPRTTMANTIVSPTRPLVGIVRSGIYGDPYINHGDSIFVSRGFSSEEGGNEFLLGPIIKVSNSNDIPQRRSSFVLFNPQDVSVQIRIHYYGLSGDEVAVVSETLTPYQQKSYPISNMSFLESGFWGWVRVESDSFLVAELMLDKLMGNPPQQILEMESYPVLTSLTQTQSIPQLFKSAGEGGVLRSSQVLVVNPNATTATVALQLYNTAGTPIYQITRTLPVSGAVYLDLGAENGLANGTYSAYLTGSAPLYWGAESWYDTFGVNPRVGEYEIRSSTALTVPYVRSAPGDFTVFSVQNSAAVTTSVTISYYNANGVLVYVEPAFLLGSQQSQLFNQRRQKSLPIDFVGYAVVKTDPVVPLGAIVDSYQFLSCLTSTVRIEPTLHGVLEPGSRMSFSAEISETAPFFYAWSLDGMHVGEAATWEHTFATTGTYTVTVNVADRCGLGSVSLPIEVRYPTAGEPDLSQSWMQASSHDVTAGQKVTYTLLLRNDHAVTATALVTDVLPAGLTLVTDSLRASRGIISYVNGTVLWHGSVASGTPVLMQFAATVPVTGPAAGTLLTNTAIVNDGLGNEHAVSAAVVYQTGFDVMVNQGALWTKVPTVTVGLSWPTLSAPITEMRLSNEATFSGSNWMPVTSTVAWTVSEPAIAPKTVYVQFRDGTGREYGPFTGGIVYDAGAPEVGPVHILPWAGATLRISGLDDNSGVGEVQVSVSSTFTTFQAFAAGTDIPWPTLRTAPVYVRVVDRAGNLSPVQEVTYPEFYRIYLPLTLRKG